MLALDNIMEHAVRIMKTILQHSRPDSANGRHLIETRSQFEDAHDSFVSPLGLSERSSGSHKRDRHAHLLSVALQLVQLNGFWDHTPGREAFKFGRGQDDQRIPDCVLNMDRDMNRVAHAACTAHLANLRVLHRRMDQIRPACPTPSVASDSKSASPEDAKQSQAEEEALVVASKLHLSLSLSLSLRSFSLLMNQILSLSLSLFLCLSVFLLEIHLASRSLSLFCYV